MTALPPDHGPEDGPESGLDPAPGRADPQAAAAHGFDRRMLEALVCPVSRGPLSYDAAAQELISNAAHLAYPIRGGIPVMLASEAREIG